MPTHRTINATATAAATAAAATRPVQTEHWKADAGTRDVARLDIPADARRERRFEIFCRLLVANKTGHPDARHGLKVLVDGSLEWERTIATHADESDSLELRFSRTVPTGRALRISAACSLQRAQRLRLTITADEE